MNEILDKILPHEARAEFCQIFRSFFGAMEFHEKMLLRFTDLLTIQTRSGLRLLLKFRVPYKRWILGMKKAGFFTS